VCRTLVLTATVVLASVAACMAALVVAVLKPAEAAFPGRNGDIVFIKEKKGNTTTGYEQAIHRMKPDGTNVRKIYYVPEYNTEPAWSADGTKIAFEHADVSVQVNHDIWLMDADGSDAINLTQKDAIDSRWPAWFPSGRKIVFSSDWDAPNHNYYLYSVSFDTAGNVNGTPTRITSGDSESVYDITPSVSPDGSQIAFSGSRNGEDDGEIYVIDADRPEGPDNRPVQLTDNATLGDQDPDWSPNGTKIVFVRMQNGRTDVFTMNADGTGKKNLTRNQANDQDPAFSPDGRYITFASDRHGDWEIMRMRADGSRQVQLTKNSYHDYSPDWQPLP
jgi:Tol biopolymer transport system component